jgi:hypothetical protein
LEGETPLNSKVLFPVVFENEDSTPLMAILEENQHHNECQTIGNNLEHDHKNWMKSGLEREAEGNRGSGACDPVLIG